MSLSSANIPQPLPCEGIDQAWLDQLNGYLLNYFNCILANQTAIAGLIQDLPSIICNEVSPRHFSGTDSGTGGTLSVSLPSGGSWDYIAVLNGSADAEFSAISGGFFQSLAPREDNPDNDVTYGGSSAGNVAGGFVFDAVQPSDGFGTLSVFAYRVDC